MMKELFKILLNRLSILFLLTLIVFTSSLQAKFEFTPNCQKAMQEILDLRTLSARELLDKERKLHPDNGYVIYLEQFADAVELIVTDDSTLYFRLIDAYDSRCKEMDRLDDGSPYNSILQAEMLLYVGLAQVKYGSQLTGASKILSSYRSVKDHVSDFPDFTLNLKMSGMYFIMMDFIPQSMRWITDILGFDGNAARGMTQLKEYFSNVRNTPGLAEEAVIMINLAYKLTWQDPAGLEFMAGLDKSFANVVLINQLYASSASFSYKNDLAIQKLMQIDRSRIQVPFYGMDYLLGRCLLNRLDQDARLPLEIFLKDYTGEDYKKDVCNRLSYYYLLQGDLKKYNEYRKMVSTVGRNLRDRDLEAIEESKSLIVPHIGLLKARLLFDGGNFHKADSVMREIPPATLSLVPYQLEFSYRQGRIGQMLGKADQASIELKKAFEAGAIEPYTFATRAALQLGSIYEGKKDYPNALFWYKKCLETYDEAHTVGSVKDKAEKGKKRMEKLM